MKNIEVVAEGLYQNGVQAADAYMHDKISIDKLIATYKKYYSFTKKNNLLEKIFPVA